MMRSLSKDLKEVLETAWPLMLSTGLFSITMFVDRMLLYKESEQSAAAAMAAGTFVWALTCLPAGICGYTSTFVAQYLGVGRVDRALQVVWQGLLIAFCMGPLLMLVGVLCESFFLWSGHEAGLAHREAEYFQWLVPGAWANITAAAMVGLFAGSGKSIVLLYCDAIVTALNGVLAYALIFGYWGFPHMGVRGAALASSIVLVLKLGLLIAFVFRYHRLGVFAQAAARQSTTPQPISQAEATPQSSEPTTAPSESSGMGLIKSLKYDSELMKRLIRYGWPAGVSVVAEAWSFTIIMMIVGNLGERPAAATTLALGVNLIAFIPLIGLGIAVGVLVGKYLVQGQTATAKRMVFAGLLIGMSYAAIFVIFYGGFPDIAMNVYSVGTDAERFDEMRPTLRPLLYFIAAYCIFDAVQTVFVGALKGAGDTLFVLGGHTFAGGFAVSMGLLVSYWFDIGGLYYWWSVISVWVILLSIVFTGRYLHGGWQNKRVIEPQLIED